MNHVQFQEECLKTEKRLDEVTIDHPLMQSVFWMIAELGDVVDQFKRVIVYGTKFDSTLCQEKLHGVMHGPLPAQHFYRRQQEFNPTYATKCNTRMIHGLLGLISEACELAQWFNSYLQAGDLPEDRILHLLEELGDFAHYEAYILDVLKLPKEAIYRMNRAKLEVRHGNSFNADGAVNRRKELEKAAMLKILREYRSFGNEYIG